MKPIFTREQLVWEIREIILKNFNITNADKFSMTTAEEIADLVADLNNNCFHKEEIDEEDDGQPSELTEWQDYDPDC